MNVLYVVRSFPNLSESFVLNELHELKRRGHNVAVFARASPEQTVLHDEHADLNPTVGYAERPSVGDITDLISTDVLNSRVLRQAVYRAHPKYHAGFLHLAKQCIEYVDSLDEQIDHIHAHFATQDKLAAVYAAAHLNVPCTVTAHATELFGEPNTRMLRVLFARIDRAIVPSRYNRSYLREQLGVETPIDVVPATTRLSKFEPTDREIPNRILTIARLVEKKGIIYAVEAVARLCETHPNIEYHIVGSGEREDTIQRRVAELGVEDHVTFLGNVSDERLHRELGEAAVFVLPSVIAANGDRDSSPVALKEAMATATPCVSTTVAGIPEIIEHETDGLLVEPRDTAALADALSTLLANDDERHAMGRRAHETITTKFSLEAAVDDLLKSFRAAHDGQK